MPTLLFSVTPGDDRPIYRQIVEQVKAAIASGRLKPGEKLPTHRDMARDLVVAPLTVKRAYDVLAGEGFIEQAQGRGTFVREMRSSASTDARGELALRAQALVRHAQLLGLTDEDVHELVTKHWSRGGKRERSRS